MRVSVSAEMFDGVIVVEISPSLMVAEAAAYTDTKLFGVSTT
jgi:hypothetical protein